MTAQARRGFALPLVLWALALSTLSVLALMEAGQTRMRAVRAEDEKLIADMAAEAALARVSYLLATQRLGVRALAASVSTEEARDRPGRQMARAAPSAQLFPSQTDAVAMSPRSRDRALGSLYLDGRPFVAAEGDEGAPRVVVEIQDEAGLLNLNTADHGAIARLLDIIGVKSGEAPKFAARLLDYVDGDNLVRLGGADGADYRRSGLTAPRNTFLDTPAQAFGALGWREGFADLPTRDFVRQTAALAPGAPFNPNTATREVLQAVFGIDAKAADRLIATREEKLLLSVEEVIALTGSTQTDLYIRPRASRHQRVKVTVFPSTSQGSYVYVARLSIAQDDVDGPILQTRLETPMRARSRERTGSERDGQIGAKSANARLRAP